MKRHVSRGEFETLIPDQSDQNPAGHPDSTASQAPRPASGSEPDTPQNALGDGAPKANSSEQEEHLAARYQLERKIGEGGMGEVWLATDRNVLNSKVAIKMIRGDFCQNEFLRKQFQQECQALGDCDHQNIVPLLDMGRMGDADAFVMKYVDGINLADLVARVGPLPIKLVRQVATKISIALQFSHAKGFVHRDVKPSNILRSGQGLFLTDFGLALFKDTARPKPAQVMGTEKFMSPEQRIDSNRVGPASDQYSLAVTLLALMRGNEFSDAHSELERAKPKSYYPVLKKAMAPQPSQRFTSVIEFAREFDRSFSRRPEKDSKKDRLELFRYDSFARDLTFNAHVTDVEFAQCLERVNFADVLTLSLLDGQITDSTLQTIALKFKKIRQIIVSGCQGITKSGLQELANCQSVQGILASRCGIDSLADFPESLQAKVEIGRTYE